VARFPTQGGARFDFRPDPHTDLRADRLVSVPPGAETIAERAVVLSAAELPPGARAAVEAFGTTIALFNVGGAVYALENRCAHHGGPLCHGRVTALLLPSEPGTYRLDPDRPVVVCPWHGWEYDLASGRTIFDPRIFVRAFEARIEDGRVAVYDCPPAQTSVEKGPARA
jgi:nitrite reductase/ring-hydroxylating ferredoxin subunit